jgi:hypothetical protein
MASTDAAPAQRGRFVYPDGATYEGEYITVDGAKVKHGKGKYSDAHASYDGEFVHDQYEGSGLYVGASGATFEGRFKAGRMNGEGTYRWSDGAVYVGSWVEGVMQGKGQYTSSDGVQYVGKFYNGQYVDGTTHVAVR